MRMHGTVINQPSTWRGTGRESGMAAVPTAALPCHPGSALTTPASPISGQIYSFLAALVVGQALAVIYVAIVTLVHWLVHGKGHRLYLFALITLVGSVVVSGCIGLCLARRRKGTDRSA